MCDDEGDTAHCSCYLFHWRSRSVYVYNGCLAWYDVLLNPRNYHSSVEWFIADVTKHQLSVFHACVIVRLTLRYTTPDIHCIDRRYKCHGGISWKKLTLDVLIVCQDMLLAHATAMDSSAASAVWWTSTHCYTRWCSPRGAFCALSSVHTSNNIKATLLNATNRTILSTKSKFTSTLLPFLATMLPVSTTMSNEI